MSISNKLFLFSFDRRQKFKCFAKAVSLKVFVFHLFDQIFISSLSAQKVACRRKFFSERCLMSVVQKDISHCGFAAEFSVESTPVAFVLFNITPRFFTTRTLRIIKKARNTQYLAFDEKLD